MPKFLLLNPAHFFTPEFMPDPTLKKLTLGAQLVNDGAMFRVWAPLVKQMQISLSGESLHDMTRDAEGYFELFVPGVKAGDDYQYILDGEKRRPDPVSRYLPEGVHGVSRVIDPDTFCWTDQGWRGAELKDSLFYEVHVGTFTPEGNFQSAISKLPHLRKLGVTHIELMPIIAFPGKRNWGYDGVGLFAVQNSYGTPDDFKSFVNACHETGLAVCLDVVYNHLGPEGNYLWDFGKYFTEKHKTPWGQAVNFDDTDSRHVRNFILENVRYWIREYHIDALRLDAVHEIHDDSSCHILDETQRTAAEESQILGRKIDLIAETGIYNPRLTQKKQTGGFELDSQWCDDFHHTLHVFLTGERQGYYEDFQGFQDVSKAVMNGSVLAGRRSKFWGLTHHSIENNLQGKDFVVCMHNHDQIGNRAFGERLSSLITFEEHKVASALLLLSPYIPLLFMGEEYGEENPFGYFVDHGDPWLKDAVREGRYREFSAFGWKDMLDPVAEETFLKSKLSWDIPEDSERSHSLAWYSALIRFRKELLSLGCLEKRRLKVVCCEKEKTLYLKYELSREKSAFLFCKFKSNVEMSVLPEESSAEFEYIIHSQDPMFGCRQKPDSHEVPSLHGVSACAGWVYNRSNSA